MNTYKIGIIGAAGLTGKELIKNLLPRKDITLEVINSHTFAGREIREIFPEFIDLINESSAPQNILFTHCSPQEIHEKKLDILFLALGSTESIKFLDKLTLSREKNPKSPKIIDLSADFRFANLQTYTSVYQQENPHKQLKRIYGLPEISGKNYAEAIKKADIIANPGCYATASLLATYPLKNQKISHIILDGKSGVSGAGARPNEVNNFNQLSENCLPYQISHHRHTQEIQQFFSDISISFTPHVLPVIRGMIVTAHIILKNKNEDKNLEEKIYKQYQNFYKDYPNIIIQKKVPSMREVQNTNNAILGGFQIDHAGRLVIVSAIDNLAKGASTQAIQNMDILLHT